MSDTDLGDLDERLFNLSSRDIFREFRGIDCGLLKASSPNIFIDMPLGKEDTPSPPIIMMCYLKRQVLPLMRLPLSERELIHL